MQRGATVAESSDESEGAGDEPEAEDAEPVELPCVSARDVLAAGRCCSAPSSEGDLPGRCREGASIGRD